MLCWRVSPSREGIGQRWLGLLTTFFFCCCFLLEAKHPQVTIWIYFWTFRHSKWAVARCSIYVNNVYLQVPICTIKCTCNYNAYISVMMSKTSQYAILHEYEYLSISEFMYEHVCTCETYSQVIMHFKKRIHGCWFTCKCLFMHMYSL